MSKEQTIPAFLVRDLVNAGVSHEHDYNQQDEFLHTLQTLYMHVALWKTPDWAKFENADFKNLVADLIQKNEIGETAETLKINLVGSGFKTPATWLMPTFFSVSAKRAVSVKDRRILLCIVQLAEPFTTQLSALTETKTDLCIPAKRSSKAIVFSAMLKLTSRLSSIEEIVSSACNRVSDKTAKKIIAEMIEANEAERPEGKKGGARLTIKGKRIAEMLAAQIR